MTRYPVDKLVVYDVELYPNYMLIGFQFVGTDSTYQFRFIRGQEDPAHLDRLRAFLSGLQQYGHNVAGFNSKAYDDQVTTKLLDTGSVVEARQVSVNIIVNKEPPWNYSNEINSIDLMQLLPGRISLKKVGVCLGHRRLQELPFDPTKDLTPEQMDIIDEYNLNDLAITAKLAVEMKGELELRQALSDSYDQDVRSKGRAAIAETIMMSEYHRLGHTDRKYDLIDSMERILEHDGYTVTVPEPDWWQALVVANGMTEIIALGDLVFNRPIRVNPHTKHLAKGEISHQVAIADRYYRVGIGGLHSVDGPGTWLPAEDEVLMDVDVTSYYPSIMLTQGFYPRTWGVDFLAIYQGLVDRRLAAKATGDDLTSLILKIAINGTFGKASDPYSALYDPKMLVNVTLFGQISLLTLIHMVSNHATVCSANTDGITILAKRDRWDAVKRIIERWEKYTRLQMEYVEYKSLIQRDVNSYVAVKTSGELKQKGYFIDKWPDLEHTPSANIIATAIAHRIRWGNRIEDTIFGCKDLNQFVITVALTGDIRVAWGDMPLGKVVRFYKSVSPSAKPVTRYQSTGEDEIASQVPDSEGCVAIPDLPEEFPFDIDYRWYVQQAEKVWSVISTPKQPGGNIWAQIMDREGLPPVMVKTDSKQMSRAGYTAGSTDFTSMPPGFKMGVKTGSGVLAKVTEEGTEFYRTTKDYPSRTRATVQKNEGFTLYYGPRVPFSGPVLLRRERDWDNYYTSSELKRVKR